MKKLAVFLFALTVLALNGAAFSLTDPFYKPEKGQIFADLSIDLTNEDARFDESFGIKGMIDRKSVV